MEYCPALRDYYRFFSVIPVLCLEDCGGFSLFPPSCFSLFPSPILFPDLEATRRPRSNRLTNDNHSNFNFLASVQATNDTLSAAMIEIVQHSVFSCTSQQHHFTLHHTNGKK